VLLSYPFYLETSVSIDQLFLEVLGGPYEDRWVWFDVVSLYMSMPPSSGTGHLQSGQLDETNSHCSRQW